MSDNKVARDNKARPLITGLGQKETLCFDKNDFLKDNFSVDEFLHKNRVAPSLEQLRDNLGLYLKGLRASMIDLINEDYADFVSLSANLVDLDKSIDCIKHPVQQFGNEIAAIQTLIEEQVTQIQMELENKRQVHLLQRNLESLKKVYKICTKLRQILAERLQEHAPDMGLQIEHAAIQLQQLQINARYANDFLTDEIRAEHAQLEKAVYEKLRQYFVDSLKTSSSIQTENLERCLNIYTTLNACNLAEEAFRDYVVAPYMNSIITEQSLQNCPQGLAGIYGRILNFLSLHMTDLLRLTLYTDKFGCFNFLVNSFWTEVEYRLETHMSSIFAPGNAEIFFAKYKCSRDFISKIEELLANKPGLQEFQQHKQTLSFQTRWNLPVYFQICFQEIAGQFEGTLDPLLPESLLTNTENDGFRLLPFTSAQKAMQRCWAEGVFLPEVFNKFYKLNMQIILRLSHWIKDLLHHISQSSTQVKVGKLPLLIFLHVDVQKFADVLPQVKQTIFENVPSTNRMPIMTEAIESTYGDFLQLMLDHMQNIRQGMVNTLLSESGSVEQLRQVNDLPRLYRKTNREVPTRCSNYVEQLLRPLKAFATQYVNQIGQDLVEEVLAQICSQLTQMYYASVSDVLTSVQKTEESLRRLRNLKSSSVTVAAAGITDDDKIRMQLRVDVSTWMAELEKLNLMPAQIDMLQELHGIVENSIKSRD